MRRWRALLIVALLLGLCLAGVGTARAEDAATPELEVVAPDNLRVLLEKHLDLARAIADHKAAGADQAIEINESEWARLVSGAVAQARTLVQTEGYFAAEAHVEREGSKVRLVLKPGPIARVGNVVLDFQGELGEALARGDPEAQALRQSILEDWPLKAGTPFRNDDWGNAKGAVIAKLRAQAYAAANWSGTSAEVVDPGDGRAATVRIFGVADSGVRFYSAGPESIAIQGLAVHDAERVRALAGFGDHAPLTETRLLDYQDRLMRTGLFDQVSVALDPDAAQAGLARVLVQLKEAPLQNATFGVGYGSNTGPRTSLEYTHRQVFGLAATARNKIEYGRDRKAWDGEVSMHPNEKMQRYLVGGTYELLKTDEDRTISQRLRLGRSEDLPKLERLAFVQFERSNECSFLGGNCVDPLTLKAASVNLYNTWRQLDSEILPTKGYSLNAQVGTGWAKGHADERSPAEQPASGPYARLYGRLTGYQPLPAGFYGEGRIELGGVLSKNDVIVPDSQRFRAGGDDSVRGYDYRTLAPTTPEGGFTGGTLLLTASAEVAHPISRDLPTVWWAAFVDAGRAADSTKELKHPALGYGLGLRWRSPVGPLKFDVAYGQTLAQWRLHVSVGVAF